MWLPIRSQMGTDAQPDTIYWGGASYYRERHLFHSFPDQVLTNCLDLLLSFSAQLISAWILEKQADETLVPVFQITDFANNSDSGCYVWQEFTLTTNQIHS